MIDRKPNLAAYARVSYLRELHGDLDGAVEAMRLAVAAGGPAPENNAYVQRAAGELERRRGRASAAGAARASGGAGAGARTHAGGATAGPRRGWSARGRRSRGCGALVDRLPLPEYVIALGEAELAAGTARRGETSRSSRAEQRLQRAAGVDTDVELAVFEADHGDPRRAVALARRGYAAAPSARAADALGWALTRAGDPRAGLPVRARGAAARLGRPALARPRRALGDRRRAGTGAASCGSRSRTASTATRGRRSGCAPP